MPIMRQDINFDGNQKINFGERPKTRKKWVQILKCAVQRALLLNSSHCCPVMILLYIYLRNPRNNAKIETSKIAQWEVSAKNTANWETWNEMRCWMLSIQIQLISSITLTNRVNIINPKYFITLMYRFNQNKPSGP